MPDLTSFSPLFEGELLVFAPTPSTRALGEWGRAVVATEFGASPEALDNDTFRQALNRARSSVAGEQGRELIVAILRELSLPVHDLLLDTVRLRAITPGLENLREAAPAFYAHRDTWYGNPRAQINGWLPLVAAHPDNSFRFFLDDFDRPVANDSARFDADHFQARGGFGRTAGDPVSVYPRALESSDSQTWDVELERDGLLLFSAAHLHQTLPNRSGEVRFSLDFRFVARADLEASRGAPDPDNRSQGSFLDSYRPCVP